MANWYRSELLIEGDVESIKNFQYKAMDEENHLNFTQVVKGVDFSNHAFVNSMSFSENKGLEYSFESRHRCYDFIERASHLFPTLTFTYTFSLEMMGFCGKLVMKNGEELEWEEEEYDFQEDMHDFRTNEENEDDEINLVENCENEEHVSGHLDINISNNDLSLFKSLNL